MGGWGQFKLQKVPKFSRLFLWWLPLLLRVKLTHQGTASCYAQNWSKSLCAGRKTKFSERFLAKIKAFWLRIWPSWYGEEQPLASPGLWACCPSRPAGLLSLQARGPAVPPGPWACCPSRPTGLRVIHTDFCMGGAHGEDKGKFKPTTKLLWIQLGHIFCTGARATVPCRRTQTNYQLYPQQNSF